MNQCVSLLGVEDLADAAGQTSAALILALLGNIKARRVLLESVSKGLSPKEAQLVDLAGTFNRMDARIAAGQAGKFGESWNGPEHGKRIRRVTDGARGLLASRSELVEFTQPDLSL